MLFLLRLCACVGACTRFNLVTSFFLFLLLFTFISLSLALFPPLQFLKDTRQVGNANTPGTFRFLLLEKETKPQIRYLENLISVFYFPVFEAAKYV